MTKESPGIDHDMIRELARLLDETGLTEIEFERKGERVRVARQVQQVAVAAAPARSAAPGQIDSPAAGSGQDIDPTKHPGAVTSPMVGTAYMGAEPGARPFIEVGSRVRAGETRAMVIA